MLQEGDVSLLFLSAMRFEKDNKVGETIKMNIIVYLACIGIALGLSARYCFGGEPRYLITAVCLACGVYMSVCLLRFIRFFKNWENTFLQIDEGRVCGLSINPLKGTGESFEIRLDEVDNASIQDIELTRRTPLLSLTIRTSSGKAYYIIGIKDINTARSKLLPESWA